MHMQSLGREFLLSYPVEVRFAGFKGDTLSLAHAGWDLSCRQERSLQHYGFEMTLALRHEGSKLYALTAPLVIDNRDIVDILKNPLGIRETMARHGFDVVAAGGEVQVRTIHTAARGVRWSDGFEPIDPNPQLSCFQENLSSFKFFRVANPTIRDIVVLPEMVPELLEKVLQAQAPALDEIRKRERSRENMDRFREAIREGATIKAPHQVELQLITCAS